MKTPSSEEFIKGFLSHEYDPAKRREYYLRTRQLKGRHHGQATVIAEVKKQPARKSAAQVRKELQTQEAALQARLSKLKKVLAQLVSEAKARSGVKEQSHHTKNSPPQAKHETQKQREAARKAEQKYRDKHKNDPKPQTTSEKIKALKTEIQAMQARITKARQELAAQRHRAAKRKAGSVRASRYITHK